MRGLVAEAGLDGEIEVESAGTGNWHIGYPPDERSVAAAAERGVELTGEARQVAQGDFDGFDLLIAMDRQNRDDLLAMAQSESGPREGPAASLIRGRRARRAGSLLRRRGRIRRGRRDHRALVQGADRGHHHRPQVSEFRKSRPDARRADFEMEAAGLRWLAEADGIRVPEVLGVGGDPGWLALERIETGRLSDEGAEELGRGLAAMHATRRKEPRFAAAGRSGRRSSHRPGRARAG